MEEREKFEQGLAKTLREVLGLKRIEGSAIRKVLIYLQSQGMVRLVDRKPPEYQSRLTEEANQEIARKAGFGSFDRLIEEDEL